MTDDTKTPPPSTPETAGDKVAVIGSPVDSVTRLQMSEAVRAEMSRCAEIARRHLNMVASHNSDEDATALVAQGYANAAQNILHEISGPGFTRPEISKGVRT